MNSLPPSKKEKERNKTNSLQKSNNYTDNHLLNRQKKIEMRKWNNISMGLRIITANPEFYTLQKYTSRMKGK